MPPGAPHVGGAQNRDTRIPSVIPNASRSRVLPGEKSGAGGPVPAAACHPPKRESRSLAGLNSPGTVCRDRLARPGRYRAFAPANRRYRSGDAPPSFVVGKRNTSRLSIVITVSRPAECACRMRRNPASVSSIIPSSWTTKSRPGSRGRQSGMALARHESKCVQGATTEISRRTLSASAIAQSPYSRPLVIARRPPLPSITPKGPRVKKSAPPPST
jgi:hypothetical protein